MLNHLQSAWDVDRAIACEEDKLVAVRFGNPSTPECARIDEMLRKVEHSLSNYVIIYVVDIGKVPDFNQMYELFDAYAIMFFYRKKHIMIDLGTGNNNKINFQISKQDFIDVCETIYRSASKGKGSAVSIKNFGAKNKY